MTKLEQVIAGLTLIHQHDPDAQVQGDDHGDVNAWLTKRLPHEVEDDLRRLGWSAGFYLAYKEDSQELWCR